MGFFSGFWARIIGGWKTVGATSSNVFGAALFDGVSETVVAAQAMKLSAYFSCVRLLSETMGSMSFQLFDNANNLVVEHDLYGLMRSPNNMQTGDAFVAAMTGNKTVYGNSMALIRRLGSGKPYSLDFYSTDLWGVENDPQGRPRFFLDKAEVPSDDVVHWPGMSLNGYWGLPTLLASADALLLQIQSNRSAASTFSSGLRAGGFFMLPENRQAFGDQELEKFKAELAKFNLPENVGKWLPLLPGMKPTENKGFRIDPVSAELLQSRYFGIEEICRFMGVPPPLIGHTDKASSWASSLDGLNQFLVSYTLLPQAVRFENELARKLLTKNERAKLRPKFNMDSLLRGDITKRFGVYDIGLKNGVYTIPMVRGFENIPGE